MTSDKDLRLFRFSHGLIAAALTVLGIWLGIRYLLPVFLPFLAARLMAAVLRPVLDITAGKRQPTRKITAAVLLILFVGLGMFLLWKGLERGLRELGRLMEGLSGGYSEIGLFGEEVASGMTDFISHLPWGDRLAKHPLFDGVCAYLSNAVISAVSNALNTLSQSLPSTALSIAGRLPALLLFSTTFLLSSYDFCAAASSPETRLIACLPPTWAVRCEAWRKKLQKALGGYLRAYVLLGFLTFAEMLLALSILRLPYALLLAALIALLDFLPVLGVGTALVPWAVACLLSGRGGLGTALLVIFGVHTLLRQILEPRMIGRELGLSPLASLVAVYAGWKLFGVTGMILSPLAVMMIKEIWQDREKTPSGV